MKYVHPVHFAFRDPQPPQPARFIPPSKMTYPEAQAEAPGRIWGEEFQIIE